MPDPYSREEREREQKERDRMHILYEGTHPKQVARIGCYGFITRIGGWLMILTIGLGLIAESQKSRQSTPQDANPGVERAQ
jgi:hypothetical protein